MAETISYRFRLRRRLAAAWASLNEVLLDSEIGLVSDTRELKVGDGTTAWNALDYIEAGMKLERLGDVDAAGRTDGSAIVWDAAAAKHVYSSGGVGGGGGAFEFVGETTLAAAATSITVAGLDLDADEQYHLEVSLKNAGASVASISLGYNGDSTATNYYRQRLTASNSGVSALRLNDGSIENLNGSSVLLFSTFDAIRRDLNGLPRAVFVSNAGSTDLGLDLRAHVWLTSANVTSITVTSSVASALAAGSYVRVWKLTRSAGGSRDPNSQFEQFDDLVDPFSYTWTTDNLGAGAGVTRAAVAGRPGCVTASTGTSGTGIGRAIRAASASAVNQLYVPGTNPVVFEAEARFPNLPDATETYSTGIGLRDQLDTNTALASAGVAWDSATSTARFRLTTRTQAGVSTTVFGSGPVPVANQWHRFKLRITSTQVDLYVDGVLQASNTTNLPDRGLAEYLSVNKEAGTTARTMTVDWVRVTQSFPTGRPA